MSVVTQAALMPNAFLVEDGSDPDPEPSRSGVDHLVRMTPPHSGSFKLHRRLAHRYVVAHNKVVDEMTDVERRVYATILATIRLPKPLPMCDLFIRHSLPGVWALRRAHHMAEAVKSKVVPFVVAQPAMVDQTIKMLGGEDKLDQTIDVPSPGWQCEPEVAGQTAQSAAHFPDPAHIVRVHGDTMLHTLSSDMEQYLRVWTEMQVVMSNLRMKTAFLEAHDLSTTCGTLYVGDDGHRHLPYSQPLLEWVNSLSKFTAALPVPICVHVAPEHVQQRVADRHRTCGSDPKGGYKNMLPAAAGAYAGQPSLWHLTRQQRHGLTALGIQVPSECTKFVCEGCRQKC